MAPILNLNNEVVKMRKEVKKIRVLSIRKLTRHLAKLKSKKGTKEDILRNQRRAQRLLEEIHAMKEVKPDDVTKTALQKDINFEKVCRMNGSSAEERAIARLATHPQFKKRIDDIKAAVKAFKEERLNPSNVQPSEEGQSEKEEKPVQSLQVDVEITEPVGTRQKNTTTKQKPIHGRDGKKRDTKVHLTPLPKGTIDNGNIASQKEETSMLIDSNENVFVSLKEDVPSSPGNSNPSAPQEKMPAALTIDSPDAPAENIPDPSTEDTSATQGNNLPAALFKSITVIPKPDIPATPKEDTPVSPKEDVPSFAEGEDIDKEGTSFLSQANMAASTIDKIAIISKDVLSISQKQKDKLYAKQTKNVTISKKGKSFSVQRKLDKSKVMDSDTSDMEESDNEDREYFDDSTEERFLRQSSGPDDSDSEDDFFLGKVKQTKKRKGTNPRSAEKVRDLELSKVSEKEPLAMDSKVFSSGTHKANTKLQKLESVFCRSLAQSKPKATLTKRNIKDPPEIKKKGEFQRNKPHVMKHQRGNELTVKQDEKKLHSTKQDNKKQKFHNVKQERKIQLQQPLHPSWEASKKRKEQQSQITAFQGKKIRFDD